MHRTPYRLVILMLLAMFAACSTVLADSVLYRTWAGRYRSAGHRDAKWDKAVEDGFQFWNAGKNPQALAELKKAIDLGCKDATVLFVYGRTAYLLRCESAIVTGAVQDALGAAEGKPDLDNLRAYARNILGLQFERDGRYAKALPHFEAAVRIIDEKKVAREIRNEADGGVKRCRAQATTLPANATKDQARAYVKALLDGDWPRTGRGTLYQDKLAAVGSEHADVLIEAHRDAKSAKRSDLGRAIIRIATPENKPLILAALPEQEWLAVVVDEKGWEEDARETLLKGLARHPRYLPYQWVNAAARLKAPESYDDLIWYFSNGANAPITLKAIEDLPGIKLRAPLAQLWKKTLEYKRGTVLASWKQRVAAAALDFGVVEPMGYVFDSLGQKWGGYPMRDRSARGLILRLTDATGDDAGLRAWYRRNRGRLVFDENTHKYRVDPNMAARQPTAEEEATWRRTDALREARKLRTTNYPRFVDALQAAADLLPRIAFDGDGRTPKPVSLEMNTHAEGLNAFRFTVPAGEARDMLWTFTMPGGARYQWYIAPAKGKPGDGFTNFHTQTDPNSRSQTITQYLSAERLTPGDDYIIWFDFTDPQVWDVPVSIRFVPKGSVENKKDALMAALGVAPAPKRAARPSFDFSKLPGYGNGGRAEDWFNKNKWQDSRKALAAAEATLAESPEDPDALRMRHFALSKLRRYKEAEEFGVKAIPVVEKSGNKECLFWLLLNQVHVVWTDDHASRDPAHSKTLHKYKGSELADRVVAMAEEMGSDNLRFRAYYIQAIWVEHSLAGHQWDRAIEFYKKAMAVAEKNGWTDRVRDAMGGVAEVLACTGKLDESIEWSTRAGRRPHPYVTARRKEYQTMYDRYRSSVDACEQMTLRQPTERLAREVIGWNQRGMYDYFVLACMNLGRVDEAIETAERLHNRTLGMILGAGTQTERAAILASRKESGMQLEARVEALGKQLALARTKDDAAGAAAVERDLKVQSEALQQLTADITVDELELKDAKLASHLRLGDMRKLVPDDAAIVFYYASWAPFMKEGFIAVISGKGTVFRKQKGLVIGTYEKQGLQPLVDAYLEAVRTPDPGADAAAMRKANDALHALLLAPIAEEIKPYKHLIIIPGGPLVQVPIHLLRDGGGRALLEDHSVSYVPSVGVLRNTLARRRRVGGSVTVLANPALAASNASLKFAEDEAKAIAGVFPKTNLLLGDRATETAAREALASADVLHFACHGLLNTDFPMRSALALTPDNANDGLLTAREICDYPVKAGLVVLSACQSGSGGMSAGWIEMVGMTRAWLLAGTPSVAVALWNLDDRSTSELMAAFYANLKTMSRAEALRRAQLAMMRKYENPYHWGAFVLYGEYR